MTPAVTDTVAPMTSAEQQGRIRCRHALEATTFLKLRARALTIRAGDGFADGSIRVLAR